MNQFEILIDEADKEGIKIIEKPLKSKSKGLCKADKIAIREDIPTLNEKACILAEELGHYHTTAGNIIDLQDVRNRKQELKARLWAYNNKIGLLGIIQSYEVGCISLFEMAEYLEVTEAFLNEALEAYRKKYGLCTKLDNYIIYFEPSLAIVKMI